RRADDPQWCVLQMPQLWGNQRLFLTCRSAGAIRSSCGYMARQCTVVVKKIEDCASTAVLNKLDVREGSQGNIRPSVYSFQYTPSTIPLQGISPPTSLRPLPGHPLKCDVFYAHRAARWVRRGEHSPRN